MPNLVRRAIFGIERRFYHKSMLFIEISNLSRAVSKAVSCFFTRTLSIGGHSEDSHRALGQSMPSVCNMFLCLVIPYDIYDVS